MFQLPTYATGTPSGESLQVSTAFTTTNVPGINNPELGNLSALYNLLTGRVAASSFTRVVNPETLRYDGFPNTNVFSTTFGVVGAPTGSRTMNLRATLSF